MSTVFLTTVGTSLLGNLERASIGKEDLSAVLEFLRADPAKASAETNSLLRLLKKGDRVELLHSDTADGRWCAERVAAYLREQGLPAELFAVKGLAYEARGFVDYGLRQFVQLLAERIREVHRQGHQAAINATGGFKAEIGLLLEEMPDGYTVLSPLGQAYLEAFRAELEQAQQHSLFLSKRAWRDWEGFDPSTKERYRRILERLRLANRSAQSELKSGRGDALGFPKGRVDERLFYAEEEGRIYVFALARHGPEYERLCAEGVFWRDYPKEEFKAWEG